MVRKCDLLQTQTMSLSLVCDFVICFWIKVIPEVVTLLSQNAKQSLFLSRSD